MHHLSHSSECQTSPGGNFVHRAPSCILGKYLGCSSPFHATQSHPEPSPRGGKHHRFSVAASLKKRLLRWRDEGITQLWLESTTQKKKSQSSAPTLRIQNVKRALYKGREGHYGKAIQCLQSSGVAAPDNPRALEDLHRRHPQSTLPTPSPDLPSALAVLPETVRTCLSSFPKGSSPGASNLRIQHLVDAYLGSSTPATNEC